jgi:hypothetical protein
MTIFDQVILGQPYSKSNCRQAVTIKGKSRLIKSKKALEYEKIFNSQCKVLDPLVEEPVFLLVEVWYASWRPDLEIELIQDLLQNKVYKNDRQVVRKMAVRMLPNDKQNPRARIRVALADQ